MSLAAEARDAVRRRPFLYDALCAGVVNYRAAADYLDLDGDPEAVATALRRFAEELDPMDDREATAAVRMQSGVGYENEDGVADENTSDDVVVSAGDARVTRGGELTAIRVSGDVDATLLTAVVERCRVQRVLVDAAGVAGDELVLVVPRRQGATALRLAEACVEER
ncbi:DUF7523 family protein [Salinigranum halophilum]|uniref:DUF7523 family protein n=1 Tax=Salinigranum halophilum TaxID=2565931 RepID=UPI0010A7EA48|nr:hypothetical protein [Salinigranum halophilum]